MVVELNFELPDNITYLGPLPKKKDNFIDNNYLLIKRLNDILFSIFFLSLTWPLMIFLIILIKLDSKGPAIYTQERATINGKPFKMYKLRTMVKDADKQGLVTNQNDTRITRIGKLIRKLSLDEFPQIINILKGDMSYIGPRAQPMKFAEQWKEEGILEVRPGILGWAMLHGREELPYEDRFKLEREYIENLCWATDYHLAMITVERFSKILYWTLIPLFIAIILIISAVITFNYM